jgi:hypothetical protein|tara:strand:+ start:31204 stop:31608 length:405 start_codon:yes stop_codon:yes gene_type:complete
MATRNSSQLNRILRGLEEHVEQVVIRVTLNIHGVLVKATPVDVGWARANWIPNLRVAWVENLEGVEPKVGGANSKQQQGVASVLSFQLGANGPLIYISNNVPYILKLNDGHSRQAPSAFIQKGVKEGVKKRVHV